jgi:hypothetical protein
MEINDKNLIFYKIMKYPIPKQKDFFEFQQKLNSKENNKTDKQSIDNNFSRKDKNKFMDKFIKKINKY